MLFHPIALALAILAFSASTLAADPTCQGFEMRETSTAGSGLPGETSFLWKITKKGNAPSYLLGSFHTDARSVLSQWEALIVLMSDSSSFATETSFAPSDRHTFSQLAQTADPTLPGALGPDFYPLAQSILEAKGLDDDQIARLKPWAAFLQLAQPPGRPQSLDSFLYLHAARLDLQLAPLQSPEEMADSVEALALADQIRIAKEAACNHAAVSEQVQRLQQLYVAGDVRAFLKESDRLTSPVDGLTGRLFTALVNNRNKIFLPRLKPLLDQGGAMIAVGAGHLFGESGLLRALARQGYGVEAVDRAALSASLFTRANQMGAGPVEELLSWAATQGLEVPAGSPPPRIAFLPTPDLEKLACGGPCKVDLYPKGDKVFASIETYHQLRQRDPAIMARLLGFLVQRIQAAQLAAAGDRSCASWKTKFIENRILQGKYLESTGLPASGAFNPGKITDCR